MLFAAKDVRAVALALFSFICCIFCHQNCSAQNKISKRGGSLLTIPFGVKNKIIYNLKTGTYAIFFDGKETIKNAYAICKAGPVYDSRNYTTVVYSISNVNNKFGKGKLYTITHPGSNQLQQLFTVFPDKNYFIAELTLKGENAACNYMAPLIADNFVFDKKGDNRSLFVPFDNDMWVRYNAAEMQKANFTSSEVTALYNNDTYNGIVIGSLEHTLWKSGVQVTGASDTTLAELAVFAGYTDPAITHDQLPHGNVPAINGICSSPKMMIGYFDDWRNGMETYAKLNGIAEPKYIFSWKGAKPIGWNSWGSIQAKLNIENAKAVVDFFAGSLTAFRTADSSLFIDLDSYWDNMTPGGIDGDVSKLKAFVGYCKQKGFKPGIYWAPFVDWGKTPRKIESSLYSYEQTWTTQNGIDIDTDGGRAMDPTHPGTRDRIIHYLTAFKQLGFKMIKIDFLSHGAIEADHFYDPAVTTGMQAFSKGMQLVDSVLDGRMLVYAAISPNIATSKYVHVRRIACDAFSAIDNTEYTLNSTGYGWWQNELYNFVDADHVVFGNATDEENRARLTSSLITGTLITGDDYSKDGKWTTTAKELLQKKDVIFLTRYGKIFRPVEANTTNKGVVIFEQIIKKDCYVAVVNYSGEVQDFNILLNRLGLDDLNKSWQADEIFTGTKSIAGTHLTIKLAGNDAAIYRLHKD